MSNGSQVSAPIQKGEPYVDALKKHLPAGLLGTYLATDGIVGMMPSPDVKVGLSWAVFALCLVACPFWMFFYEKNKKAMQIVFACISLAILIFLTGGPLAFTITDPNDLATVKGIAAIAAILFTGLIAPIVSKVTGE